jgi:hypothetical protein
MAFYKGDKVKVSAKGVAAGIGAKCGGKVKYIACVLATTKGGKTCDKKTCAHTIKDHIWVEWPDGKTCSYHHQELELDGIKNTPVIPDAASFKAKAAEVSEKIKKAEESGLLGADNGKKADIDWDKYNTRLPGDTRSRVQRTLIEPDNIENADEIDWDVYAGFKRGPLRKVGADRKG